MRVCTTLLSILVMISARSVSGQALVAETPPLSGAEQRTKFHLPPGFEIQLVAEEPAIHKPMNMKFDALGRLWVTHSLEYPFPAKNVATARDAISIFSDFAADGRAHKVERFAEHLNIPIGVLPLSEREVLAWSIPNIYRLIDSNGDGVADEKSIVYGPFGYIDTHGDQNAFTRWIDGWVYANHGFSNESHVKQGGVGPDLLQMNSGNTYRFRPDGTAIEQYSWGQVNPFGLSFDPLGNLYSADCHSSAVSLLLREGYYQSFGKPHDGLGFAPEITHIDHGGTGIAGVLYSSSPNFPPEYRDVLFVGNVITNRVHCDRLQWTGSTPAVTKVEDFLICDDPWFRPVDIQPGPDGALYVADFYNCIIGHYEVPLTHPKRDRERGRIWRIVYLGAKDDTAKPKLSGPMEDLRQLGAEPLFELLGHANLMVRVLATHELMDRFPQDAAAMSSQYLSQPLWSGPSPEAGADEESFRACHAVWLLQRTTGLAEPIAVRLTAINVPPIVRVHAVKALGEMVDWHPWQFKLVQSTLQDNDSFVRRAAAEALAKHPAAENLLPLLAALKLADSRDAQLYHQIRIAVRNQLRSPEVANRLLTMPLSPTEKEQLVAFAVTAPTGPAAILIFDEALHNRISDEVLIQALPAAARFVDAAHVDAMIDNLQKRFPCNVIQQISLLRSMAEGLTERGLPMTDKLRTTLSDFIRAALAADGEVEWYNTPLSGSQATASPWVMQTRSCQDGGAATMISSLPEGGERLGGVLRSPVFELPARMSFWICGHDGRPDSPGQGLNYARLMLENGTEVARSSPPRDDVARRVAWDLTAYAKQRAYLEVVDGITDLDGFAWIAVSRFEPAVITTPGRAIDERGALRADLFRMAGQFKLTSLGEQTAAAAESTGELVTVRLGAAEALVVLEPERAVPPLQQILASSELPTASREQAAQQLGQIDRPAARDAMRAQLKAAPESVAIVIATGLAAHADSADALLREIAEGRAPARLLTEAAVVDRLQTSGVADLNDRIAELTADLNPADNRIATLIAERRAGYLAGKYDPEVGRSVFAKSVCAQCHRIGDVGNTIAPALDGIGNRGIDRLLEDMLDPSRNVDLAFRTYTIETDAGQVLSGFGLREEGATLVLHDSNGQQVRVPLADVVERSQSTLSPMPWNATEQMPTEDYFALLAYLLSLKN